MAICMESIAATEGTLYARDQWSRLWSYSPDVGWRLLPPPPGSEWYAVKPEHLTHQPGL